MRVAVVGPTHPYKGGVAAHTTELAWHLAAAGHETDLVSWSRLYPSFLYPGEQVVPDGAPDLAPYGRTTRPLSWRRPDSWVRVGQRLRSYDLVVVVHVVPAVAPAHLALLRALRAGRGPRPRVVVVAHNVLPHEPHPGAAALVRALLTTADATLVHTQDQAQRARELGAVDVGVVPLPPHLPGGSPLPHRPADGPPRLLALGIVRPYKGVDVLLEALAQVPGPTLTIAGELWGAAGERVRELAAGLGDRVELRAGYVPATSLAGLIAGRDVLALPYRSATASQNALLGFAHGMPVLATRVGTFAEEVSDGVDGLLAEPGSVDSLVFALRRLCEVGAVEKLRDGVRPPDLTTPWAAYVEALTLAGRVG
ncbi:MAG TPA: glycosyltransferase family 4 protein [Actinomycetales bacterium]